MINFETKLDFVVGRVKSIDVNLAGNSHLKNAS